MYNAYLCAKYDISIKGVDDNDKKLAKEFYEFSKQCPDKIVELPFVVESDTLEGRIEGHYKTIDVRSLKPGTQLGYVLDVAAESFAVEEVKDVFHSAKPYLLMQFGI